MEMPSAKLKARLAWARLSTQQFRLHAGCVKSMQLDRLMPRGVAPDEFDFVARAVERFCEQTEEGFICC